jgi:hypothetical protein
MKICPLIMDKNLSQSFFSAKMVIDKMAPPGVREPLQLSLSPDHEEPARKIL